jgi:hypothetical protein
MDVKLQIEDAIVFYHGKQVFVRMIKKKEEFIANVRASFNASVKKGPVGAGGKNNNIL